MNLGIYKHNPIDYDPEIIPLVAGEIPEELRDLQKQVKQFLKANAKHWSAATLSQFLGIDINTLKLLAGDVTYNTEKSHTVLVLKPITEAEADNIKYLGNLL